ncbi:hypothetical protein RFI_37140, partial [Reticulomyxa filosa]
MKSVVLDSHTNKVLGATDTEESEQMIRTKLLKFGTGSERKDGTRAKQHNAETEQRIQQLNDIEVTEITAAFIQDDNNAVYDQDQLDIESKAANKISTISKQVTLNENHNASINNLQTQIAVIMDHFTRYVAAIPLKIQAAKDISLTF